MFESIVELRFGEVAILGYQVPVSDVPLSVSYEKSREPQIFGGRNAHAPAHQGKERFASVYCRKEALAD